MFDHTPSRMPRTLRALAAGAVVLLGLVGCAGGSGSDEQAADSALPAAEGTTQYPLTLPSPFGETVLEERPERIAVVTAATYDSDALIALGVTPVFAPSTLERNTWLDPAVVASIETLWDSEAGAEISAEQVAASAPDLIVSLAAYDTFDQAYFDRLSAIAPVLYAPIESLSWQELTRAVGAPLDLAAAADALVGAAEEHVAAAKAAHPQFAGRTAAQVTVYAAEYGAEYGSMPGTDMAALFESLGFVLPEGASQFDPVDGVVSDELVSWIDADFLLLNTVGTDDVGYFLDAPLVQQVPAVAEGRAVVDEADPETGLNSFAWALGVQSVVSVPWAVDRLAEFGVEALG